MFVIVFSCFRYGIGLDYEILSKNGFFCSCEYVRVLVEGIVLCLEFLKGRRIDIIDGVSILVFFEFCLFY